MNDGGTRSELARWKTHQQIARYRLTPDTVASSGREAVKRGEKERESKIDRNLRRVSQGHETRGHPARRSLVSDGMPGATKLACARGGRRRSGARPDSILAREQSANAAWPRRKDVQHSQMGLRQSSIARRMS